MAIIQMKIIIEPRKNQISIAKYVKYLSRKGVQLIKLILQLELEYHLTYYNCPGTWTIKLNTSSKITTIGPQVQYPIKKNIYLINLGALIR